MQQPHLLLHRLFRIGTPGATKLQRAVHWRMIVVTIITLITVCSLIYGSRDYAVYGSRVPIMFMALYLAMSTVYIVFGEFYFWFLCELARVQATTFAHKLAADDFENADEALLYHIAIYRVFAPVRRDWKLYLGIALLSALLVFLAIALALFFANDITSIGHNDAFGFTLQMTAYFLDMLWQLYTILQGIGRVNDAYERIVSTIVTKQLFPSPARTALLYQMDEFPTFFRVLGVRINSAVVMRVAITFGAAILPFVLHTFASS
jgi:hypothetical protein